MIAPSALIPIHDQNPTRTFSFLTAAIIVLNVLVFVVEPQLGMGQTLELAEFFCRWGVVPREIVGTGPQEPLICARLALESKSVYLSLVTSMFLHGGPIHLIGNMLFLWVFGNNIEDTLGRVRFVLFYFVCGVTAGLAHVIVNPGSDIPTVGASGAVSGLLGAYLILFPHARITTLIPLGFFFYTARLPATVVLGLWFVSQFFLGLGQQLGEAGVAWVAHVGGFVTGIILILALGGRRLLRRGPPVWG